MKGALRSAMTRMGALRLVDRATWAVLVGQAYQGRTLAEAATVLGVHPRTAARWVAELGLGRGLGWSASAERS